MATSCRQQLLGGHGATDLENPPRSAAPGSPMSLSDCEAQCEALSGCTGITVAQAGGGKVNCYRKSNIVADQCDKERVSTRTRHHMPECGNSSLAATAGEVMVLPT